MIFISYDLSFSTCITLSKEVSKSNFRLMERCSRSVRRVEERRVSERRYKRAKHFFFVSFPRSCAMAPEGRKVGLLNRRVRRDRGMDEDFAPRCGERDGEVKIVKKAGAGQLLEVQIQKICILLWRESGKWTLKTVTFRAFRVGTAYEFCRPLLPFFSPAIPWKLPMKNFRHGRWNCGVTCNVILFSLWLFCTI